MKFRPLHDRVVIKRIEAEERTTGGIIIPDTAKEKPQEGEVIAVGPGGRDESGKLIPIDVKVGDRVLFGKWSGTGQARRRRVHHHERKRPDGGACGSWRRKKGRLILPETSRLRTELSSAGFAENQPSCRATNNPIQTLRSMTWLPRK